MGHWYLPSSLASILDAFSRCFTSPTRGNFARLVCGWLLCRGRHTISRMVQASRVVTPRVQHARLYRFFSRAAWEPDALARVLLALLLPLLPKVVEAAVDDTLCKKGGAQVFGAAMHRDGSASSYAKRSGGGARFAFGHNWVVLSVRVPLRFAPGRGIAVPLLARLYRGKKGCPEKLYEKRTELAQQMIALLAAWLPTGHTLSVAGDSEYACRTIVRALPKGVCFVGPVCRDAALHQPAAPYSGRGRPAKKGARLPNPQQLAEDARTPWRSVQVTIYGRDVELLVKTLVCLWPTVAGERPVRIVLTRDPSGRFEDRCYFCTDPDLGAEAVLVRISHRWELEVTFRDLKQVLGIDDPQNGWWRRPHGQRRSERRPGAEPRGVRGKRAVERTVPTGLLVHGIVVVWYLRRRRAALDVAIAKRLAPWRTDKSHPCFADMLAALREAMWRERISAYPIPDRVRRNLVRLLAPAWRSAA